MILFNLVVGIFCLSVSLLSPSTDLFSVLNVIAGGANIFLAGTKINT